jgi:hypothetical protein
MRAHAFDPGRTLIELAHAIMGGRSPVEGEI